MKKQMKAIVMILLFVMLISPVKVNATQPEELYPLGVIVEIIPCSPNEVLYDDFIVDIVIKKEELFEYNEVPFNWPILPSDLLFSEYADLENEWVSALLYIRHSEWDNTTCSSIMFGFGETLENLGVTEFKVVVYEKGQDPIVSIPFTTDSLASYEDPIGYKIIYNPIEKTFIQQGYEAEWSGGYNGGFVNFELIILIFGAVLISIFGAMESLIYLLGRSRSKAIYISLGFNMLVVLLFGLQFTGAGFYYIIENMFLTISLVIIPAIYLGKIWMLYKYAPHVYKVSILISITYYAVYFYFFMINVM
jgi:hypothetical protein